MLNLTDGRGYFTNKSILAIYLQQAQTSGEVFKNYPFVKCECQKDEGSVVILTAQVDGKEDKNMTAFLTYRTDTFVHIPKLLSSDDAASATVAHACFLCSSDMKVFLT